MSRVLDAQVVKGYFEESVLGIESDLTGSPVELVESLRPDCRAYVDSGGIIEHEYDNLVDSEWFQAWYAERLIGDELVPIETATCHGEMRKLRKCGFPNSRDRWYVRTALAVVQKDNMCVLVTEDLDFYDPAIKGRAGRRKAVLLKRKGPVAKYLRSCAVEVYPVADAPL